MSKDLTRWNRAGLSRFQYIDGNAPVWLEDLRHSLAERFPIWERVQQGEGEIRDAKEMEAGYQAERSDLLWETTRAFARAGHILTQNIEQYANEAYIGTVSQWDNLRRLVKMIDYHPAPPASAATWLVMMVKENSKGTLDEGFKVKYSPQDGGNSVVFETLEDIDVNDQLNTLHVEGWDRGAGSLADGLNSSGDALWQVDEDVGGLLQGQVTVVEDEDVAVVDSIARFDESSGEVVLAGNGWHGFNLATAQLYLKPLAIRKPLINGNQVVELDIDHSLVAGNVVGWKSAGEWKYASIKAVDGRRIRLDVSGDDRPDQVNIYRAFEILKPADDSEEFLAPVSEMDMVYFNTSENRFKSIETSDYDEFDISVSEDADDGVTAYVSRYIKIKDSSIMAIYLFPDNILAVGTASIPTDDRLVFPGGHGELAGGDWVVIEDENGARSVLKIETIDESEETFSVDFNSPFDFSSSIIERMYGPFKYSVQATGSNNNQTPLHTDELNRLVLDLDQFPEQLGVDRKLVIGQVNDEIYSNAMSATITKVDKNASRIEFTPALDGDAGFTRGNTVIYANVVNSGHGERQPERVLGSGEATASNQIFQFNNAEVSFVADVSMESGVRADIDIIVDNQTWRQVSTLNDSGPTDTHYCVRMTEEGYINICFGDGSHGRRLPSGNNNLRIAWRKGAGLSGNLDAGSLTRPVKPHYLLDEVRQPLPSSGGGGKESIESLRDTAPASVLTLKRAVSLSDFKHLASAHSSVWQANAFRNNGPFIRGEKIQVVVVPAGGVELSSELQKVLEEYLRTYTLPGVAVSVTDYLPVVITLDVKLRIKSDSFDPEFVKADVKSALLNAFKLEYRALGKPLYRAELYQVVEAVQGVENSDCTISSYTGTPLRIVKGDSGVIRMMEVEESQVIYVAEDGLGISVQYEEYAL